MKTYIQFFHLSYNYDGNHPEHLTEALGDTGVFILDARNNLNTMIVDAEHRIDQLRDYKKYTKYEIRTCSRLFEPYRVIHRNFDVKELQP